MKKTAIQFISLIIVFCLLPGFLFFAAQADDGLEIAALVNGKPISKFDIQQQGKLLLVTSNIQPSAANIKRAHERSLEQLIENILRREEAQKHSILVSQKEVEQTVQRIIGGDQSIDQFIAFLKKNGIYQSRFYDHIRADLLWRKVIEQRIIPRIILNQSQVDARLAQVAQNLKQPNFLMSWIVLPFENKQSEKQAGELARQLRRQLREGASFDSLARNFSRGPNASQGGDLGWLPEDALALPLRQFAQRAKPGNISNPLRLADGFYLVHLRDRREAEEAPAEKTLLHLITLRVPIAAGISPFKLQKRIRQRFPACDQARSYAKTIGGDINDLGFVPSSDLSENLGRKLRKAKIGTIIPSLTRSDVQEFLAVCGRKVEAVQLASRRAIENRMISEQAQIRARQMLRDLRRNAHIEQRDNIEQR